jgi:asparagine synthase (glutamine-hydrolysing)
MLNWLNGMFAFVIINTETNNFFAARDRLGVKPLYWYSKNGNVILSSEIAPIIELTGESQKDEIGIRQYRKLRTFFNNRTLYKNIKMFPAGHYLENNKLQKYWELPLEEKQPPSDEELKFLIEDAVNLRCISDVPVGSYLSGGLDSTIVAALSGKPHTWTVGFHDNNEFKWAKLASEFIKSVHHEVLIDKDEFLDLTEKLVRIRKEPLSVPNEVLIYKMTKEVKQYNTVILSGEGADELFAGYDRIFRWAASSDWNLKEFTRLYSYGSNEDYEIVEDVISPYLKYRKNFDIITAFFQTAHLHGLLRRLDNSTMLCSVEAREPFCDYRLVERLAGVDFTYKLKDGIVKDPLKRIFKTVIPKEIIERSKVGFPVDLKSIFPNTEDNKTPMDRWLEFNLKILNIEL